MATPITHIVLTEKIFYNFFSDKEKKDFFIGTSFPDIRYLGVIKREKTHFTKTSIQEIQEENDSFLAGMKFHSLLDLRREEFVTSNNLYNLLGEFRYKTQAIKLLEDEILYKKVNDWHEYIGYFKTPIIGAKFKINVSREAIIKWYKMLQVNFGNHPNDKSRKEFIEQLPGENTSQSASEINDYINNIRQEKPIVKIINKLYDSFEEIIL